MTLVFTAVTSKNDVTLCKLDVNVKNRTAVAGSVDFFQLQQKPFKGESVISYKFFFENQNESQKGMQEKVSIMDVWCG